MTARKTRPMQAAILTVIAALVVMGVPCGAPVAEAQTIHEVINDAVGFWSFSEGSGTTAGDSSGTAPDIELAFGASPSWQTSGGPESGVFGNYLAFASGDYLTTGGDEDALDFDTGDPFSVAGWVNPNATANAFLACKMESSGSYRGWFVYARGSAATTPKNCVEFWLRHNNTGSHYLALYSPAGSLPDSEWKHVAVTYDGSTQHGGVVIYIDGVEQTTTLRNDGLDSGETTVNSIPFNIGGRNNSGNFRGGLDEIGVWRRVLTHDEVVALMSGPQPLALGAASVQKISTNRADLVGTVTDGAGIARWGTMWGTNALEITNETSNAGTENAPFSFTNTVAGMPAGQQIYYHAWASNATDGLKVSATNEFYTEPHAASAVVFTATNDTDVTFSWTPGAGSDGSLVAMRYGAAVEAGPDDGSNYMADVWFGTSGTALGSGYVVCTSAVSSVTVSNLLMSTYHVAVYAYAGAGDLINYQTNSPAVSNVTTTASADIALDSLTVSAISSNGATLGATIQSGSNIGSWGTVWDTNSAPTAHSLAAYGTPSLPEVFTQERTGMTPGSHVYFRGWASNATEGVQYSAAEGQFCVEPLPASGVSFSSISTNSMTVSWTTNAGTAGSLVVMKKATAVTALAEDGSNYTASAVFSSGYDLGTGEYAVHTGALTSVTVTNLSSYTTYYAAVYAYSGSAGLLNYQTNSPATGSERTLAPPGLVVADFNDLNAGGEGEVHLLDQAGGIGFTGNWAGSGAIDVYAGDLTSSKYSISQPAPGQAVRGDFNAYRSTYRTLANPMSGEIWFSFLANLPGASACGGISFNPTSYSDNSKVILFEGNNVNVRLNGVNNSSGAGTTLGSTVLVVGQMIVGSGNDTLKVWIDPDLVADPDIGNHTPAFATTTTDFLTSLTVIGVISYRSAGSVHGYVDSIRFSDAATAFFDVVGLHPLINGNGTLFLFK